MGSEAPHMFRCFVGRDGAAPPPPPSLLSTYDAALAALAIGPDALTSRLVEAGADLASAELALRRRDPVNHLTQRALLMLSLAEARPEYAGLFTAAATPSSRLRAWAGLAAAPWAAVYGLAKGNWLLWRYGPRI